MRAALADLRPRAAIEPIPPGRSKSVVLVLHLNEIEPECNQALHALERLGLRVVRRRSCCSAIDVARNEMISDAHHDGCESILFVDADCVTEIILGPESPGPYPLEYAAAGFLRVRASALRLLIERRGLPLCNIDWGRGCWPFFRPIIADAASGNPHYLGEDWAFSHRPRHVGITPLADATIRLYRFGRHGFSWEDTGDGRPRHRSDRFRP